MKKTYFLLAAFLFFNFNVNAQITEGFETCLNNDDPFDSGDWWDCGGGSDCYFLCSDEQAKTGSWSGLIPGDESRQAVLNLGNKIFGEWGLEFWMYVPSGKVAYWNLQGVVPIGSGEMIVGNVFFNQDNVNPGVGLIDDSALGEVNFNFPHDQWFKVVMNIDLNLGISVATWQLNIDGEDVLPLGTPFTNEAGEAPQTLGGVDFFSISSDNELYVDDILYVNDFINTLPNPGPFTDDMESYTAGEPINEAHWTDAGCGSGVGCSMMSTSVRAHEGNLSGLVSGDGTTKAVLHLGNKIFAEWGLDFWAYIPEGKEASMIFHQEVPVSNETPFSKIYFNRNLNNPGTGVIENTNLGDISFNFPHNQWFRIAMNWDINTGIVLATWVLAVDNQIVIPFDTPYTNEFGESATSLGGVEFSSLSLDNEFFVDDFTYQDEFSDILNANNFSNYGFKIYPNPTENLMHIQSNEAIKNIVIYNVLGKNILSTNNPNSIDTSLLAKGIYFVVVETDKGKGTQKLIKN